MGSTAMRGYPLLPAGAGMPVGAGPTSPRGVRVQVTPPSVDLATTMGWGAVLTGSSRFRQAMYTAPSGPTTGGAISRTCSSGPWASTGADHVLPPSSDVETTALRSPAPPDAPMPGGLITYQPTTYTLSPLGRGWTATPGRMTNGRESVAPLMATVPTSHVLPPSPEWLTITESPSPATTLLSGRCWAPRWEANVVYTFWPEPKTTLLL